MSDLKTPISLENSYSGENAVSAPQRGIFVTLPDVSELETFPASGLITFRFSRENLRLSKENKLAADIHLCELVEVEADEEAETKTDDVVDKLFAEADANQPEDEDSDGSGE